MRSIKESCLERLVLFGETSLRTAVQNFVAHYHSERNHQGLDNHLIQPEPDHLSETRGEFSAGTFGWPAELLLSSSSLKYSIGSLHVNKSIQAASVHLSY